MQTLYDILNIQKNAPAEIISAAHKALIGIHQPYADAGDEMESATLQKINNAYRILSDPDTRSRYDEALSNRRQQQDAATSQVESVEDTHQPSSEQRFVQPPCAPVPPKSGNFLADLWRGHFGLFKTYWGYGVLGGFIWGIAIVITTAIFKPGSAPGMVLGLTFFAYIFIIYVAVWRAANLYTGPTFWAYAAKFICILPLIGIVAAVALPPYQAYKKRAQMNHVPNEIEWGKGDFLAPSNRQDQVDKLLKDTPAYHPSTLPQDYQSRVAILRRDADAGKLSVVDIRQPSATDGTLNEWSTNEVATVENWQTWWTLDDVVGIHVTNLSTKKMSMLEIKHAPTQCELTTNDSFTFYNLPLERPVEAGTQAVIRFTTNGQIPPANGCLVISRIRG